MIAEPELPDLLIRLRALENLDDGCDHYLLIAEAATEIQALRESVRKLIRRAYVWGHPSEADPIIREARALLPDGAAIRD